MKRVLLGFLGAAVLFFAARAVVLALASPETKIRWRVEEMVDGFNRQRASPVLRGFSMEFRDESSNAGREMVHKAVTSLFFTEKDPETKAFTLRAEIPEDTLNVVVAEDPTSATVSGVLIIHETKQGTERVLWRASFEGEMTLEEKGWRFRRSTHETVDGARPR